MSKRSPALMKRLFREMLRIRNVELRIESLYHLDEMKTPVHLCIGQEAVAVGVCANLRRDDYISSTHRGHGHYLAKGGSLKAMIAELYCRETGCSGGYGGSMHLVDTSVGHMGSSSIVGGSIPLGTGLGLAAKMRRDRRVSAVFFGDGAADEGVLYESLNFAMLRKLPVVYIYENNQYSVCSPVKARHAAPLVFHKTPARLLFHRKVDGNDVLAVYDAAKEAVGRARGGSGPSLVECVTYRMRGHSGGPDTGLGYRKPSEIARWEARCPVTRMRRLLAAAGGASAIRAMERMTREVEVEIDKAFRFAVSSPLPAGAGVVKNVFREQR